MLTSSFELLPPLSASVIALIAAVLLGGWLLLRAVAGQPVGLARRAELLGLRAAVVVVLFALLAGPVRVDETPGPIRRPDVFLLLDSSESMAIGTSTSRWEDALHAIGTAKAALPDDAARRSLRVFRFGHRLSAVEAAAGAPAADSYGSPQDSDTRLAEAMRQLSGRFGQRPPAAVVLLSDGRARDAGAVEQLARHFGEREIPIHAYPIGDTSRGGDVAIVSVVAPERVRKFTDVDVQVFLRSFGYTGQRSGVELVALSEDGAPEETLATLPVTLRGGAQSATLTFRSDMRSRTIEVRVSEQSDELSTRNNRMTTDVSIDRTKIRVLYVEGSNQPIQSTVNRAGSGSELTGPFRAIQDALSADEDIECFTLVRLPGSNRLYRAQSFYWSGASEGLPETVAQLAAFDAVILSDVPPDYFTEEQLGWLKNWIENRGGGLCMTGGDQSFAAGGWHETPLAELLPVRFAESTWRQGIEVNVAPQSSVALHAIWQIVTDREQNQQILGAVPPFIGAHGNLQPRPQTDVLAVTQSAGTDPEPLIVAGRYGRGRTLAVAVPIVPPAAERFMNTWGPGGNRYGEKFWRNVVYWLTEGSFIGRRRLIANADKRFYRPGETISLKAVAYDESARRTDTYSLWAMVEPHSLDFDAQALFAPIRWPNGIPRESGEEGPHIAWGEEFPIPQINGEYRLPLELSERLSGGAGDERLRIELTAYENIGGGGGFDRGTQVDSTSLEVQILDDPFEQQNPFPNHDLLTRVASLSGGRVLRSPTELADLVSELPIESGPPVVSTAPVWNQWWLLVGLMGLLSIEWFWRRMIGLA